MDQYWIKTDKLNKFLRPEDKDDVRYRKLKKMNFESELKNVLPEDCNLCFHGTTIWNAEKILESGEISSRMDREGYDSELTNSPSVISVTTLNNVWFTIKNFADLHNYKYPAAEYVPVFIGKPHVGAYRIVTHPTSAPLCSTSSKSSCSSSPKVYSTSKRVLL